MASSAEEVTTAAASEGSVSTEVVWEQKLKGARVGILVEFNHEDLELQYPLLRLKEEGCTVTLIGPRKDITFKGKHGYPCKADKTIDEVTADDFDALVVPGGFAPDYWRRDKRFTGLVRECFEKDKVVAAICHGPWMFVSARILKGRTATCFVAIKDDVENAGATYVDAAVVIDKNMITSRTPNDLPAFVQAIIQSVAKRLK